MRNCTRTVGNIVNIDDGWEAPERTKGGEILSNDKFPDFKALTDYIHGLGLKFGIYSSPGATTCGGHVAVISMRKLMPGLGNAGEWIT